MRSSFSTLAAVPGDGGVTGVTRLWAEMVAESRIDSVTISGSRESLLRVDLVKLWFIWLVGFGCAEEYPDGLPLQVCDKGV